MWQRVAQCCAVAFGGIVVADPAQAAMTTTNNDAELFQSPEATALVENTGPQFAKANAEAAGGAGDDVMFARAEVVDTAELGDQRGGFALDGLDIKFGAQVQTLVNGELAMTSAISWSDAGVQTSHIVADTLSAPTAEQLQAGMLKTGNISLNVGDATVFLANNGQTALIQNVNSGLQSIVVNTANNTSIQTIVNATFDVSGYTAFQANMQTTNLAGSLGSAIGAATLGLAGH
jgi:hypothetical protein